MTEKEMEQKKESVIKEKLQDSAEHLDLASIMERSLVGKPKVDPVTGQLLPHPRHTSDFVAYVKNCFVC